MHPLPLTQQAEKLKTCFSAPPGATRTPHPAKRRLPSAAQGRLPNTRLLPCAGPEAKSPLEVESRATYTLVSARSPGWRGAPPGAKFKLPAGPRGRAGVLRRSRDAGCDRYRSAASGATAGRARGHERGGEKARRGRLCCQKRCQVGRSTAAPSRVISKSVAQSGSSPNQEESSAPGIQWRAENGRSPNQNRQGQLFQSQGLDRTPNQCYGWCS